MKNKKEQFTRASKLLIYLLAMQSALEPVFWSPYKWRNKIMFGVEYNDCYKTLYYLYKKGWITTVREKDQNFLHLTDKGQLQALVTKAQIPIQGTWDGFWRMIIFDIPERSADKRDFFRNLLKKNNFYKLQASVYINPYPLNQEAVEYLKITGLINYIRIIKICSMDDDSILRKRFQI